MKKRIFAMLLVCALAAGLAPVRAGAYGMGKVGQGQTIASGGSHYLVIKEDGTLWGWGLNDCGQLGVGITKYQSTPVKIMDNVASVSAASSSSMAIKTDGTLWAWGLNDYGRLGDGTIEDRYTPVKVMDNVAAVSLGGFGAIAIKTDGTLWVWGWNANDRLGIGRGGNVTLADNTTCQTVPVKLMDNVVAVEASGYAYYAIKMDGTLWGWGWDSSGQMGDGTTKNNATPVKFMDSVVALGVHRAIKTDGTLWAWGVNDCGQLGDGTTEDRFAPVKIMDNVAAVYDSLAVQTDGTLWVWGDMFYDPWDDTTEYYRHTPVKVMDNVVTVNGSLAVKLDGSLWKVRTSSEFIKIMDNVKLPKGTSGITQTTLTEKHYPGTVQTAPSTWAEAEVNSARDNGLVPSELDGNYTGNITRAEFCNLGVKLVKSLGKENRVFNKATVVLDGKGFSDTDDENVITMCNAGVVNGYTDGRFGPNDPITREQAAVMLARLARKLGGDLRNGLEPQYRDGLSISAWAREDVAYISRCETAGHKAVMGGSNGYFSPKNYYTREQAFLTFQRLYECATNTASGAGTSSGRIEPENNMEKGEQALAQRAVELVQTLSDQAKAKEANPFLGQEDQLEALKKTIHVTPTAGLNSDKDIPDAVYYAFAGAIYEAMEDSSIEKLEYDGNKLVNQIYDAVKNGLLNGTKTVAVTTGKGKNRTTTSYTVTYRITALAGAQTSEATVSWNNGSKRVLLTSADVAGTQKALANFCAALAQLNKEAWNEFLACYFGNAFGLMGFDIKKDDVKKALSVSEKVIKAIDDPREADKFLAEAGDELSQSVKDQLKSGWFDSEIGKLVKECVPNGDKIVEAAKVYLKAREKYDAWTSAVEARKNMDEVQKLYADFSGVLSELDSILNEIAP